MQKTRQGVRAVFFGEYTENQITMMRSIHYYFMQTIGGGIPAKLSMNSAFTKPNFSAALHDFQLDTWIKEMGTSHLYSEIKEIVAEICQYQQKSKGELREPFHLTCEAMKEWLVKSLSFANCDETAKQIVEKWKIFLNALLDAATNSNKKAEVVLKLSYPQIKLVIKIRQVLESKVLSIINNEIQTRSAREQLSELVRHNKIVLESGLSFLCYMLQDSRVPDVCTIDDLYGQRPEIQHLLKTRSGQLTQLLILWGSNPKPPKFLDAD